MTRLIFAGALWLSLAGHADTGSYKFKHLKAASVVASRWQEFSRTVVGLQRAPSLASPPSSGTWIFVDERTNTVHFGSRDDSSESIAQMLEAFDVKPIAVEIVLRFARPDKETEERVRFDTSNNSRLTFGSDALGATLEIRANVRFNKTVAVFVTLVSSSTKERASCVAHLDYLRSSLEVADGRATIIKDKPLIEGEQIANKPAGPVWKPYVITITARPKG